LGAAVGSPIAFRNDYASITRKGQFKQRVKDDIQDPRRSSVVAFNLLNPLNACPLDLIVVSGLHPFVARINPAA
jgi:hypothetical protein